MKIEYMNDLPYPNDLPQEVERWVAKCIRCNLVCQHICRLNFLCRFVLYPDAHVILKLLLTLPVGPCACEVFKLLDSSTPQELVKI